MFTCDRCRKEYDQKPRKCYCGGELCKACYTPHIESHAVAETLAEMLDEPEDAYLEDLLEIVW